MGGRTATVRVESGGMVTITDPDGEPATMNFNNFTFTAPDYCTTTGGTLLLKGTASAGKDYVEFRDEGMLRYYDTSNKNLSVSFTNGYEAGKDTAGRPTLTYTSNGTTLIANPDGFDVDTEIGSVASFREHQGDNYNVAGSGSLDIYLVGSTSRNLLMDANGGSWTGGVKTEYQTISTKYKNVTDNKPTRDGYVLTGWNTAKDGSGTDLSIDSTGLKNGQTVYAQWSKDPGKPVSATIKCAARQGETGALCSIIAYYADAPEQTRELLTSGTSRLAWGTVSPIAGVNLDQTGYAGDVSCVIQSSGGKSQCYYVSVADKPVNNTSYQAQMPTTGAPEGLSTVGLIAIMVSMLGLTIVMMRRSRN